jgi:hypothetical protein
MISSGRRRVSALIFSLGLYVLTLFSPLEAEARNFSISPGKQKSY